MRYASALDMADHTVTYRLIVKEVAAKHGVYATFMPKPLFGENGSGMHTHMSLFTDGRNRFFDGGDTHHLSDVGKQFIAGLLRHARELAPVFAQWVNSYKRLVPGLRGAGLRRVVAAQPLRADPHPALQAGLGAGDAGGDPLSRSGVQPVPDVRGVAARRARGDREGLRARAADGLEPLPPDAPRSGASGGSSRCRRRSARRSTSSRGSDLPAPRVRRPHLRQLREAQAQGVGRVPRPAHAVGARPLPQHAVARFLCLAPRCQAPC